MCKALMEFFEPELKQAEYRGEARGRAEGEAWGRAESREEIILNMHRKGCSIEFIADVTDKSIEEVNSIIENASSLV